MLVDCEATFILKQTGVPALVRFIRMSHQIRPGARGGRDQFSWDQVKEDKQRLNYLGSSIHGLPDKFKKGPETFWYAKETKSIPEKKSNDKSEIDAIKDKEKQMMEALLGGGSVKSEKKEREQPSHRENVVRVREQSNHQEWRDHRNHLEKRERPNHRDNNVRDSRQYDNNRDHNEYREVRTTRDNYKSCEYNRHDSRDYDRHRSRSPSRQRNRSRSPSTMHK